MRQQETELLTKIITDNATGDDFFLFGDDYSSLSAFFSKLDVLEVLAKFSLKVSSEDHALQIYETSDDFHDPSKYTITPTSFYDERGNAPDDSTIGTITYYEEELYNKDDFKR
jgi:hypothetical protein